MLCVDGWWCTWHAVEQKQQCPVSIPVKHRIERRTAHTAVRTWYQSRLQNVAKQCIAAHSKAHQRKPVSAQRTARSADGKQFKSSAKLP